MKKKFKSSYLKDLGLPNECLQGVIHENEITDSSRWSLGYRVVFSFPDQNDGTAWEAFYSAGATEYQDESPWEYDDEVECTLVRKVPVTIEVWDEVDE